MALAKIADSAFAFSMEDRKVACVAAGPRTRLNPLYTKGLERLRRRLIAKEEKFSQPSHIFKTAGLSYHKTAQKGVNAVTAVT